MQEAPDGGPDPIDEASPVPAPAGPARSTSRLAGIVVVGLAVVVTAGVLAWVRSAPPAPVAASPDSSQIAIADPSVAPPQATATTTPLPIHRVGERVEVAGLAAQTVLKVEDWTGEPEPNRRGLAVEVRFEALTEGAKFNVQNYQVAGAAGKPYNARTPGKEPALSFGELPLGDSVVGWVTFVVDKDQPYTLSIRTPLGYGGLFDTTAFALQPIEPASAEPTPTPTPTQPPGPGSTPPPGTQNWGYASAINSTYYSGFGATLPGTSVSEVRGSWTEPKVTCSGSVERDAGFWVGIEDTRGGYLQQLGTLASCTSTGRPIYQAWYEMFPLRTVPIKMAIHPGDRISASVSVKGTAWRLALKNTTTGASFAITKKRSARAELALWIAEAPSRSAADPGKHVLPLANYGTMTFTGCSAVVGGKRRTIADPAWAHFRFDMVTSGGGVKAITSGLSHGGTSFSSTWQHY